jgi:hypothetical protein
MKVSALQSWKENMVAGSFHQTSSWFFLFMFPCIVYFLKNKITIICRIRYCIHAWLYIRPKLTYLRILICIAWWSFLIHNLKIKWLCSHSSSCFDLRQTIISLLVWFFSTQQDAKLSTSMKLAGGYAKFFLISLNNYKIFVASIKRLMQQSFHQQNF